MEYPSSWPTFFSELLGFLTIGNDMTWARHHHEGGSLAQSSFRKQCSRHIHQDHEQHRRWDHQSRDAPKHTRGRPQHRDREWHLNVWCDVTSEMDDVMTERSHERSRDRGHRVDMVPNIGDVPGDVYIPLPLRNLKFHQKSDVEICKGCLTNISRYISESTHLQPAIILTLQQVGSTSLSSRTIDSFHSFSIFLEMKTWEKPLLCVYTSWSTKACPTPWQNWISSVSSSWLPSSYLYLWWGDDRLQRCR